MRCLVNAGLVVCVCLLASGCATTPAAPAVAGDWIQKDEFGVNVVSIGNDGNCTIVALAHGDVSPKRLWCAYSFDGDRITLTQTWGESGVHQKPAQPTAFLYRSETNTLVLVSNPRAVWHRASAEDTKEASEWGKAKGEAK